MNPSLQEDARKMLTRMGLEAPDPPAERHPPGRGSAVTPREALEIRMLYLGDGLSMSKIAERTGRSRETVSQILKHPDTADIKKAVLQEQADEARLILKTRVVKAARKWDEAMEVAATRGDHRPMKDLLLAEQIILPVGDRGAGGVHVTINGITLAGLTTASPHALTEGIDDD